MERLDVLIDALINYFQIQSKPIGNWEFFVANIFPTIQLIIIVGSALAAIYKYYQVKNREINEKMLSQVYSPLYNYFIKQELYCTLQGLNRNTTEMPILELKNKKQTSTLTFGKQTKQKSTIEETIVLGLNRETFLNMLKNVDIGLASKELYSLLSMYEVVCYMVDGNIHNDTWLDSAILKVQIENALRKEIIEGYNLYHKKLGLSRSNNVSLCKAIGSEIVFTYEIDKSERENLQKELNETPELFEK